MSLATHGHVDAAKVKTDAKQGLKLKNFVPSGGFGHGDFKRTLGQQSRLHGSMLPGFTICLDKCPSKPHKTRTVANIVGCWHVCTTFPICKKAELSGMCP